MVTIVFKTLQGVSSRYVIMADLLLSFYRVQA